MRDSYELLLDVQEAITNIFEFTKDGWDSVERDKLVRVWVIHHLEIVGEAIRSVPQEFRILHPEIPWRQISGMRNILVHHYFGIDLNRVREVVEHDLPDLKRHVDKILEEYSSNTTENS